MTNIVIRPARAADLAAVAELRWRMYRASRATTVPLEEFVAGLQAWASAHGSSHRCLVAATGETVIGMAWLAITSRVPNPGAWQRVSGDVQSVYVLPQHRGNGVGGRLAEAVLALARNLGADRVTVRSSEAAVPVYERAGFEVSPVLLQADNPHPAGCWPPQSE